MKAIEILTYIYPFIFFLFGFSYYTTSLSGVLIPSIFGCNSIAIIFLFLVVVGYSLMTGTIRLVVDKVIDKLGYGNIPIGDHFWNVVWFPKFYRKGKFFDTIDPKYQSKIDDWYKEYDRMKIGYNGLIMKGKLIIAIGLVGVAAVIIIYWLHLPFCIR